MNFKALATSAVIVSVFASSVCYASSKDDKDDSGSSSVTTVTNTNNNSNSNSNNNINTSEGGSSSSTSSATGGSATANGGSATSTNTNTNTANGGNGGSAKSKAVANGGAGGAGGNSNQSQSTSLKNYNYNSSLYYPDWMNVSPNTSSFSYNSVQCQGATLNATASTLTTDNWNNGYGVQGAIGFSVPLTGQGECFAVQKKMRSQIEFKAAVEQALMCKQLENAGVNFASRKELSVCLPQK